MCRWYRATVIPPKWLTQRLDLRFVPDVAGWGEVNLGTFHGFLRSLADTGGALERDRTMLAGATGNRQLSDLTEETGAALIPRLVDVPLVSSGLREGIYFPFSGLVAEFVALEEGSRPYTGLVGKDGAHGLEYLGAPASHFGGVVLIPGRAAWISASDFHHVWARSDAVREMHLRYCQSRLSHARRSAACNAVHGAGPRFCNWLLHARDCLGEDIVSITQEQAADMLGVRRTTVNLLAQDLQKEGIIRCGRGRIRIVDRAGLEALSCGCFRPELS
jgi:CRP-like cAMP-binding protein